jgi:hypothetical protein
MLELGTAIASHTEQAIPGQTFRMDPAYHGVLMRHITEHERNMLLTCISIFKSMHGELAKRCWQAA